jgi:cob(I)alamin adenosyltransferase
MSIATKTGDKGTTALIGGARVSKADLRVETYGTIDELGAAMGFARSIGGDDEVNEITKTIQRELFAVCSIVATVRGKTKGASPVTQEMVDGLDAHVTRIEAMPGIIGDWALPGDHPAAAAYDVARTICRRAERLAVRLEDEGELIEPLVLTYLNRLSDLLWLLGRLLEVRAGIDSKLRPGGKSGAKWSKAW